MTAFMIDRVLGPAGVTAADLAEAIASGGVQRIVLNSDGGEIRTGLALADLIDEHALAVEIHRAVSAAAIVATAGPDRSIAADGCVAVHPAWRALAGGAAELAAAADQLRRTDELLAATLARRTGLTIEDAARAIQSGRRWTADEALADGLVDRIGPPARLAGPVPERLVDGPAREYRQLRAAAERHHERAALERSVETSTTTQLDAGGSVMADTLEAFAPPDRLAAAFDAAAGDARRRALDPDLDPAPPRWTCPACGFINSIPPAAGFKPTACHRCNSTSTRGSTP